MRSCIGLAGVGLLVVLLVGATPTGTGTGAHRDQVLDLLIPHGHPVHGSPGVPASVARPGGPAETGGLRSYQSSDGPALGQGAAAAAIAVSAGVFPPPAAPIGLAPFAARRGRLPARDATPPADRAEPPDAPPPRAAA